MTDVEFYVDGQDSSIFGNVVTISLGGCYVESSALLAPGTAIRLRFHTADEAIPIKGRIVSCEHGFGFAVQFDIDEPGQRDRVQRIVEVAEKQIVQVEAPNLLKH